MTRTNAPMYQAKVCKKEGDLMQTFAVSDDPHKLITMIHASSGLENLEYDTNSNATPRNYNSWTLAKKVDEYGNGHGYPCYSVCPILLVK